LRVKGGEVVLICGANGRDSYSGEGEHQAGEEEWLGKKTRGKGLLESGGGEEDRSVSPERKGKSICSVGKAHVLHEQKVMKAPGFAQKGGKMEVSENQKINTVREKPDIIRKKSL